MPRQGEEIGYGEIGPTIAVSQPWNVGTVYSDLEPQTLFVDFVPPYPDCIAGKANAAIGRGGAVLIGVWIEGSPADDGTCANGSETTQIRVPLSEPIGDRRIYTTTLASTQGASARAEEIADLVIGLDEAAAVTLIEGDGYTVRVMPGDNVAVTDDFNIGRINLWIDSAGRIEFAAVY